MSTNLERILVMEVVLKSTATVDTVKADTPEALAHLWSYLMFEAENQGLEPPPLRFRPFLSTDAISVLVGSYRNWQAVSAHRIVERMGDFPLKDIKLFAKLIAEL